MASSPSTPSIRAWRTFLSHSLATRLDARDFEDYAQLLYAKHPLPAGRISDLFLSPAAEPGGNKVELEQRVGRYVGVLLGCDMVTVEAVLRSAWKFSSFRAVEGEGTGNGNGNREEAAGRGDKERDVGVSANGKKLGLGGKSSEDGLRWEHSYAAEETLFYRLTKLIASGSAPQNTQEAVELILICTRWMETVVLSPQAQNVLVGLTHAQAAEMSAQNMALGTLLVAVVENGQVLRALSKASLPKAARKDLSTQLAGFVPLLLQGSPQCAARLELFRTQTLVALEPVDRKEREADREIENILEEGIALDVERMVINELPVVNSRAGLYIYLNSLLVARPLIDDHAIFGYLHNRYQGDIRSTIVDLILAAFDILANATFRNERPQTITILRSFLINKIPLLLTTLSASLFPPLTSEYCITEALSQVDTNAFPTLSSLFDESTNNMFPDSVRQDFCFACCLHNLIAETSIEGLLGDIPMQSLPTGGRYAKDDLVQQCLSDPERAERLVDELENMDGNVGAVSQAITEVIARLCHSKETMSLKSLCGQLAKKPSSLDVMLLFDKPTTILQPICDLLDNWRYDEDQGEYQPVYEEFGSILLLVLSFTHRYNLSIVDLGIRTPDSFVAKLLSQGHLSRAMDDLTEQEASHLDGWIRGLFDSESGGLGDELMSSCPPQDFYLLVPTLFHHIVLACSTKNLSDENLKGGLEYLVDTFLLPSLIPGITWLSAHLWESRGDANAVLQILAALITSPASISNNTEASQMLSSILNIISKNLEHSLRWFQRAEPSRQDVEPLSKALRPHLGWERRGASDHTELESWSAIPGGGLVVAAKQIVANLTSWASSPGVNMNPASYTHRIILTGAKVLGAKRLLGAILEEVKSQTEHGNGSVALDVAAALICAPDSQSWDGSLGGGGVDAMGNERKLQRRLILREALKAEAESAPKLRKSDPETAETTVRLFRKVEAALVVVVVPGVTDVGVGVGAAGETEVLGQALNEVTGMDGMDGVGIGGLDPLGMDGMDGMHNVGGLHGLDDLDGLSGTDFMSGLTGGGVDLMDGFPADGMGF